MSVYCENCKWVDFPEGHSKGMNMRALSARCLHANATLPAPRSFVTIPAPSEPQTRQDSCINRNPNGKCPDYERREPA
jgi:hypothetical protein